MFFVVNHLRHQDKVELAEFSPDGRRIVTVSSDDAVRVWDIVQVLPPALSIADYLEFASGYRLTVTSRFDLG